ncbi:MAG: hypothetical protein Q9181_004018 [Wetmoreana brouardii]
MVRQPGIGGGASVRQPLWTTSRRQAILDCLNRCESNFARLVSLASWKRSDTNGKEQKALEEVSPLLWKWTRCFAQIYNGRIDDIPPPIIRPSSISSMLSEDREGLLRSWEQLFVQLGPHLRPLLWQDVMLWALDNDIDKALTFLDATITEPLIMAPRYAVEDALQCVVSAYSQRRIAEQPIWNKLHRLVCSYAAESILSDGHISSMPQKIVYLLLQHSDDVRVQVLYETLFTFRSHLLPYTLTHFMDRFTQMGRPDLAMDALRNTRASPHHVNYQVVRFCCMNLLRRRSDVAEWYQIQSQLATEILELGIRPDIAMLNAMILNAVEANDYQTAQAIVKTARLHGIRRDTITYSILLKGAYQNLDESLIETIMQMAEADGALPRNNNLVSCLVATILKISQDRDPGGVSRASRYRAMLRVYARYCDTRPLRELRIYVHSDEDIDTVEPISQPSPQLLSTMILGYILLFGRPEEIQELYDRYQYHIAQGHHLIASTAATDHLANAFLLRLGRNESTFMISSHILKNMLEPPASTAVKVARPTVQTWSIVAHSYFLNGQRAAGERIIQLMREKGLSPNQVTWNTIITGYARMQDAFAAVDAMRDMEKARFQVDSYTLKALSQIKDRGRLLDALRKSAMTDDENQADEQVMEDYTPAMYNTSPKDAFEGYNYSATVPAPHHSGSSRQLSPGSTMFQAEQEADDRASSELTDNPERIQWFGRTSTRRKPEVPRMDTEMRENEPTTPASQHLEDDYDHLYDIHDTQPGAS